MLLVRGRCSVGEKKGSSRDRLRSSVKNLKGKKAEKASLIPAITGKPKNKYDALIKALSDASKKAQASNPDNYSRNPNPLKGLQTLKKKKK